MEFKESKRDLLIEDSTRKIQFEDYHVSLVLESAGQAYQGSYRIFDDSVRTY